MLGRTDQRGFVLGSLGNDDLGTTPRHAHAHLASHQPPQMGKLCRCGGAGTAGFGDAGAALPDKQIECVGFGGDRDEFDIDAGGKLLLDP